MSDSKPRQEGPPASSRLLDPVDTVIAAIILAVCAYLWYVTTTFEDASFLLGENVLPEHFPRLALGFIALCALLIPFEHRIFPDRWRRIEKDRSDTIPHVTWLTMALLTAAVIAEPYIGTILTILVVCVSLPVLWGERRWLLIASFAVLFTTVITVVFAMMLRVHFEPGIFNISV